MLKHLGTDSRHAIMAGFDTEPHKQTPASDNFPVSSVGNRSAGHLHVFLYLDLGHLVQVALLKRDLQVFVVL